MKHSDDEFDEILAHIDAAVGPPEDETEEEHEARRRMVERDAEARRISRSAEGRRRSCIPNRMRRAADADGVTRP